MIITHLRGSAINETADRGVVLSIVAYGLVCGLPLEGDVSSGLGKRSSVVSDGSLVAVLQKAGSVGSVQSGEDRPFLIVNDKFTIFGKRRLTIRGF